MESGLTMLLHSVVISIILYFIMVYVFQQSSMKAQNRSILLGAVIVIYMILFGHGLPTKINNQIF